nr:MucR family transcriptional regulator [Petropleomorpha daqingensis]
MHPVGPLPASVYWRRRVLVLTLLVSVLGGGGWVGYAVATGRFDDGTTTVAATSSAPPATPALERVVPSLAGVQLPTGAASTTANPPSTAAAGPCTDDMITVEVRAPAGVAVGTQATFVLLVSNVATVPCIRSFDEQLQELVLRDLAGNRIWGSHDCRADTSDVRRTLAPAEVVSFSVEWSGLTSEPTCTAPRMPPPPGAYLLQGRLGTENSAVAQISIA